MDFQQKKLEKELQELKKLIDVHFVQRKKVQKGSHNGPLKSKSVHFGPQLAQRLRLVRDD